jgi:hypothetical protein
MAVPIPQDWLDDVCAALRSDKDWRIRATADFSDKFYKSFQGSTQFDVEEAFLDYLEGPNPVGCPVQMDYPAGTTWDFFFQFCGTKTYGKILLRTDRRRILLLSGHLPNRPNLRCD